MHDNGDAEVAQYGSHTLVNELTKTCSIGWWRKQQNNVPVSHDNNVVLSLKLVYFLDTNLLPQKFLHGLIMHHLKGYPCTTLTNRKL